MTCHQLWHTPFWTRPVGRTPYPRALLLHSRCSHVLFASCIPMIVTGKQLVMECFILQIAFIYIYKYIYIHMIWSMLLLMSVWKSDSFFPRSTWPLSALLLGAKGKSGATALRRLRSALLSQVSKLLKPCAEVELNKLLPLGHRRWTQTEFDAIRFPSGPSGLIVWSVDFGLQTCLLYHIIVSYYSVLIYIYILIIIYYTILHYVMFFACKPCPDRHSVRYLIWKLPHYVTSYHQDTHVPPHFTLYNQATRVTLW